MRSFMKVTAKREKAGHMRFAVLMLVTLLATAMPFSVFAETYDVVINNGRVMDPETNFDGVRNVGVKDGKIVIITEDAIKGKETIDASGHVVAPGFIEGHQHATDQFSRKVNLRDGLTTQMDFEAGAGDIAKWYADHEGKTQANYGMVVLATLARISVLDGPEIAALGNDMGGLFSHTVAAAAAKAQKEGRKPGWSATLPNKEEMTEIMSLVDEGLRQGALGVGVPVGYMTTGVTQYELYKYQELAAKYGRVTNAHVRFAGVRPSLSKLAVSGSFSRSRLVAPKRHEENAGTGCESLIKIPKKSTSHQARAIQCFSARRSSAVVMSGN